MKTAEEILIEFGCPDVTFDENVTMYYPAILSAMEEYANARVGEAMRWRDPEEELPEFNKEDYLSGDYKRYLIMVVEGSISTRRYVTVGWLINANRWNAEMDWVAVIGWRPIE